MPFAKRDKAMKALSNYAQQNIIGVARVAFGNGYIVESGAFGAPLVLPTTVALWNQMLIKHNLIQATELPPHNCAEAHLWLTLIERRIPPRFVSIWVVKVDRKGRTKEDSPCPNCQQWVRKEFASVNSY